MLIGKPPPRLLLQSIIGGFLVLVPLGERAVAQAPGAAEQPDIAVSERDRFYTSDQFSNTVSVINPVSNKLLGVIRLGDPTSAAPSPTTERAFRREIASNLISSLTPISLISTHDSPRSRAKPRGESLCTVADIGLCT